MKQPVIPQPPELSDDVVRLRPWERSDASSLVTAWEDVEIVGRLAVPEARGLADATRWIDGWDSRRRTGVSLDLVISELPADAVCGEVGLSRIDWTRRAALIGWWLTEARRGRGLATRAVRLVAEWALGSRWLDAVVAEIDADNEQSLRLAARCGFVRLGDGSESRQVHALRHPRSPIRIEKTTDWSAS